MPIAHLQGLYSYWDTRTDAIAHFSEQIRECASETQRDRLLARIARDVRARVKKLSDQDLVLTAVSAGDDLYKAADATEIWDAALAQYLAASADTFFRGVADRGYVVHSLIDNSFEAGMQRPLVLYPDWFRAAGFAYICPQHCATMLMTKDGIPPAEFVEALPRYDAEARELALSLVRMCHTERRHYVFLDADSVPGAFRESEAAAEAPGVLTLFRSEAPLPGSQVRVSLPTSPGPPQGRLAPRDRTGENRP